MRLHMVAMMLRLGPGDRSLCRRLGEVQSRTNYEYQHEGKQSLAPTALGRHGHSILLFELDGGIAGVSQ